MRDNPEADALLDLFGSDEEEGDYLGDSGTSASDSSQTDDDIAEKSEAENDSGSDLSDGDNEDAEPDSDSDADLHDLLGLGSSKKTAHAKSSKDKSSKDKSSKDKLAMESDLTAEIDQMFSQLAGSDEENGVGEMDEAFAATERITSQFLDDDVAFDLTPAEVSARWQAEAFFQSDQKTRSKKWSIVDGEQTRIFEDLVDTLGFIVRKSHQDIHTAFERAFCCLHLLYIFALKVPLELWMHTQISDAEDPSAWRCPVPQYRLYKALTAAFRWSGRGETSFEREPELAHVFSPACELQDPKTQRAFSALRHLRRRYQIAAMQYGGLRVLEVLEERCNAEPSTEKIYRKTLNAVRSQRVEAKTERVRRQAMASVSSRVRE